MSARAATERLLRLIVGQEQPPALIEIRSPTQGSEWYPVGAIDKAALAAIKRARRGDTYVGMAPRKPYLSPRTGRQFGGSAAIDRAWVLSADCDTDRALDLLASFDPPPTLTVASGSRTDTRRPKLHAHWALREPISRAAFERAKKRLAAALHSDTAVCDAARVMRLPGTLNHKPTPPSPVELISDHPERTYTAAQVLANTPQLAATHNRPARRDTAANARGDGTIRQKQETISPRDYVRDLAGIEVGADGKAKCPFHKNGDEERPSLMAYSTAERGWYCFTCEVGGDVYTFAALLRGIPQRDLHEPTFARIWRDLRTFYGLAVDA